jgi:uncharacterized protein (TIGR03437 family)
MRILFGILLASAALAQTAPPTCSNATLSGTHGLSLGGHDILSSGGISKVYLANGLATFDGNGNFTFNLIANTNAAAGATVKWTGTYSIPSSCMGTLTVVSPLVAAFTLIPYNSGKNFSLTGEDGTYAYTATGYPQPAACLTSTFSGPFGFNGNGYSLSSGAIAGVNNITGQLQFDGVGAVSGSWSVNTSGTSTPVTVTGTFTANGCQASGAVKDANGNTYALNLVPTTLTAADFTLTIASPAFTFNTNGHAPFSNPGAAVELAAGVSLPIPPGSLFSIYGSDLATGQGGATGFPLPIKVESASVTVNGESVPLYFVDSTLINAQMPYDVTPGLATLVVTNGTTVSNSVAINVSATAAPGIFIYATNHAVAQNLPSYVENSSNAPAPIGSTIVVYFTGGGPVTGQSSLTKGQPTPAADFPVTESYSATIGGVNANVVFVGLVPTAVGGFYEADITVPQVPSGEQKLILTINGAASNTTTVSIQ